MFTAFSSDIYTCTYITVSQHVNFLNICACSGTNQENGCLCIFVPAVYIHAIFGSKVDMGFFLGIFRAQKHNFLNNYIQVVFNYFGLAELPVLPKASYRADKVITVLPLIYRQALKTSCQQILCYGVHVSAAEIQVHTSFLQYITKCNESSTLLFYSTYSYYLT